MCMPVQSCDQPSKYGCLTDFALEHVQAFDILGIELSA